MVPEPSVLLSKQMLSIASWAIKMALAEAVGKSLLNGILTEATGKPQRWIYFPLSQSLWLLLFFSFGFVNPFPLQRTSSSLSITHG